MATNGHECRPWARSDTLFSLGWFLLGVMARAPLVARIEGVLDHDQSVVGLMALDISEGRRFPLFFDGQRYMGAFEAYIAAAFVRLLGHEPNIIALAPLLAYGLFVAGQYAVWRVWKDGKTGHLAAGLTAVGSPMLALWGIVPRGGYIELLAWSLPTLAVYRVVARSGGGDLGRWKQISWGFLLGLGYLLNPLSMTVYVAMASDWVFVRHGADIRSARLGKARWIDSRYAGPGWFAIASCWIFLLAFCCHVDPRATATGLPYIAFVGLLKSTLALAFGAIGIVFLIGIAGWWSTAPARLYQRLTERPWTLLGLLAAFLPFVVNGVLTRLGTIPPTPSLPVWISAPWRAGANLQTIARALGPLLGCDPHVAETVLVAQGVDLPPIQWEGLSNVLTLMSPLVIAIVFFLIAVMVSRQRAHWKHVVALRCVDVLPPEALALLTIGVAIGLFLLQGTSPNGSSVRYLVPIWVALPGVLACGILTLPRNVGVLAVFGLIAPWIGAHASLWKDIDRESSTRPLAVELERRGIQAIVAPTPVALIVANLSHGKVGAVEFQAIWPRLADRYSSRLATKPTLTCVIDRRFPWSIRGEGDWAPEQDLARHLQTLAKRYPGRVAWTWEIGPFEVWEVDLPLDVVLGRELHRESIVSRR